MAVIVLQPGARLKVVKTDGQSTQHLLWLRHTGSEVFYGIRTAGPAKFSYHESGELAYRSRDGHREILNPLAPPRDLIAPLDVVLIPTGRRVQHGGAGKRRKGDVVVFIDVRQLPPNASLIHVVIGLVGPATGAAWLEKWKREYAQIYGPLRDEQIVKNLTPWIFVLTFANGVTVEHEGEKGTV